MVTIQKKSVPKELLVVIYCVIAFVVLIVILILYQATYLQNLSRDYILTSNGGITVNEDEMSLIIDNRHDDSSRIIEIDGLDNISNTKIYSSALLSMLRKYNKISHYAAINHRSKFGFTAYWLTN